VVEEGIEHALTCLEIRLAYASLASRRRIATSPFHNNFHLRVSVAAEIIPWHPSGRGRRIILGKRTKRVKALKAKCEEPRGKATQLLWQYPNRPVPYRTVSYRPCHIAVDRPPHTVPLRTITYSTNFTYNNAPVVIIHTVPLTSPSSVRGKRKERKIFFS